MTRFLLYCCGVLLLSMAAWLVSTPDEAAVVIEWSTETELETAGFNLYRSEHVDGPYAQINEGLLPGSTDPLLGGSYSFTDTNVISGASYFYQLEDVEIDGTTTRHGPIEVQARNVYGVPPPATALLGALLGGFLLVLAFRYRRSRE